MVANIFCNIFAVASFALLGGWIAAAMFGIAMFRDVISAYRYVRQTPLQRLKSTSTDRYLMFFWIFVFTVAAALTQVGFISLFAYFAIMAFNIGILQKSVLVYRLLGIFVGLFWLVYSVSVSNIIGVILYPIIALSAAIGVVSYYKGKNRIKNFPKTIKTQRLVLRALRKSDAGPLFSLIDKNRGFIGAHLDWVDCVKTLKDEEKYVAARIAEWKIKAGFNWIIETAKGGLIGFIGTDPVSSDLWKKRKYIDFDNKILSFAYFLDPKYTGKGYMTEALRALIDISRNLGFKRVQFGIGAENIKSIAVVKRLGAKLVGEKLEIDLRK